MSEALTQKHLDLLNRIATSPPPIDASQMVTKLRRPSLEDILPSTATTTKESNRASMSGIYIRSRPTSFSEFDMAFDPKYDYADLLARPISPTAIKETMASLGLRLQQGQSLFMQLSHLHGQIQQDESTSALCATVVATATGRPTRPLPMPEGPPPGYVTVVSSGDGYESDGDEIVYMLDNYTARHQCMVVDAKASGQAPELPLPVTPKSSMAPMEEKSLPEGEIQTLADPTSTEDVNARISAASIPETAKVPRDNTSGTSDIPQKTEHCTSRANKRMGVLGIQATQNGNETPMVNASHTEAGTNSATPTRAFSKSVTFAPDTRIQRERKVSISTTGGSKATEEKPSVDAIASKVSMDDKPLCAKLSAADGQDQIPTLTVEVFEVDFADLEKANATSIVDGASGKKIKKKHHFGVYKVIRNVLKRNSGEPQVKKPASTVLEEPVRSKTPTPSIATTVGGRRNVLRKPDPTTKAKSSAASLYSVSAAADTTSQKLKKPFRAWSIWSGKGGRKGVKDPVHLPAQEKITGGTGLLAPPGTHLIGGTRRRSASFSGFATIATPTWDDPVDMDQLIKDAAESLRQNPRQEWVYRPKAEPILEQGENPVDVGFVLERHIAV